MIIVKRAVGVTIGAVSWQDFQAWVIEEIDFVGELFYNSRIDEDTEVHSG